MNNLYAAIPPELADEQFDLLVDSGRVRIERIVSQGHASPDSGWYDQQRDEWVVLLRGEAGLVFADGASVTMKPGDHMVIAAHRRHRVAWTAPAGHTIWLAVHY